jgi:cysteine desulfurase
LLNNINIGLPGMQSDEMVVRLDYAGFDVSHKSACASNEIGEGSYVLRAMGATEKESSENIRISMGRNTKPSEMESLILCIKDIYYKYRVI